MNPGKKSNELILANKEIAIYKIEKAKSEANLIIANKELDFQNEEKGKRAAELIIANKELAYQNKEKEKRASELIIANQELFFQNEEREKRTAELISADKELVFQSEEKEKRAMELVLANKELVFQNKEKAERAKELIIADKELAFQNGEKEKRAKELVVANKELVFQNKEKGERAKELIIADKELVIANQELEKTEEELKVTHERLLFHVDNTPLGYIEWDREGHIKYKSPKAEEIFGWTMKELLAGEKTAYDQVYAEDLHLVTNIVKQLINGEVERNRVQNRNMTKDGRVIWCEWFNSVLRDKNGKVVTIMSLVQDITERKKMEEDLWLSENRFRVLIEKSIDMKTLSTSEGEMLYCSPSITKVLGYAVEEFVHATAFDLIHPDDIPGFTKKRKEILQTPGKSFASRNRFLHKDGSWIWCEGTVTNMLNEPGVNAMVSNFKDISDKITGETEKEFDSYNLNALINNTNDLMWSVDKNFNLITSNQPFDEMGKVNFGKTIARGENVLSAAYSPEMLSHFKELYERAFAGESFTETEYSDFPAEVWTEISYYPIRKGNKVIGTACYSRDITQRKKSAETSLRLGSIVESSRDAIISLSLEGLIVSWNHAAKVLYGYSPEEVMGKPYSILLHPVNADQFSKSVERVKTGEQLGYFELEHVVKNRKLIYVSLSISPIKDAAGHLTGISINGHDISRQKRAEDVLNQTAGKEKTRLKKKIRRELVISLILGLSVLFLSVSLDLPKKISRAIGNSDTIFDDLIIMTAFLFFISIVFGIRRFLEASKGGREIQDALRILTKELEMKVQERTNDLSKSNEVLLNEIIERKKTEENLKQSEARLKEAQAVAHISNWQVDLLTGISTWSEEFYHILGIRQEDVQPSPEVFLSYIHPDDFEYAKEKIEKTFETSEGSSFFYARLNNKEGATKYVYSEWKLEFDRNSKPIRMYGILQDITKEKLAENNLKQSESRFREFFDSAPESIVIIDLNTMSFPKFNDNALKLLKYSAEELIKKGPAEVSPPFQPDGRPTEEKARELIMKAVNGEKLVFEWMLLDGNGKEIISEVRLASLTNVDGPQVIANFADIGERKKSEQKIIESELKYRSLIEQASDTIIVVDTKGSILEINPRAEKLFGYTRDELLKMKLKELLFAKDTAPHMDEMANGKTVVYERKIKRKDGSAVYVEVSARLISDGRIFGIFRDISERIKTLEERDNLITDIVQRNKDLEQFTYIVSHNLRAPVANILGASNRLNDPRLSTEKKEVFARGIKESVLRLDSVINDLNLILQLKHSITEIREKVRFSELVEEIKISIKNLIDKDDIEIKYDFSELNEFLTLKSYMRSIFYNLISNSIKYRQEQVHTLINIKSHRVKNKIELIFTDNGIGIDLQKRGEQVFGLYKRFHANIEGKGMGLFMVKAQVETLGGKIGIRSDVNEGAEFKIEFEI